MKLTERIGKSVITLIAAVAAFTIISHAEAQNPRQGRAVVRAIEGSAEYSTGGGNFQPLRVQTTLHAGDVVRTGPGSHVDLYLGRHNGVVQVGPNSTLGLDRLSFTDAGADVVVDTQLDVRAGAILGRVNKLSNASKYEIKTPRGVAGIRGTKYRVTAAGEVTVAEGTVIVTYITPTGPQTFTVNAGETITPGAAAPSKAPADVIQEILSGLKDADVHGAGGGAATVIFVSPVIEPFVSPVLGGDISGDGDFGGDGGFGDGGFGDGGFGDGF